MDIFRVWYRNLTSVTGCDCLYLSQNTRERLEAIAVAILDNSPQHISIW